MSATLPQPTPPTRSFRHQGIDFRVYDRAEDMGAASAHALAQRQLELAVRQERIGFLIMAAPSAFPFYKAYAHLSAGSAELRAAIARTDFFQFDDYPLPADHPATFRYLLEHHFFAPLRSSGATVNPHPLTVDDRDPAAVCRLYTEQVLASGPDIQLKGVGENGHWGFHEPGVPLEDAPAYMAVHLSAENAEQQLRDHPALFRARADVPTHAYTANVELFLRTRLCIEDNVPQASKAFALLAGYGSDVVDAAVPTSALKQHSAATVRTTAAAAWALEQYIERGLITTDALDRMAAALSNITPSALATVLRQMQIRVTV